MRDLVFDTETTNLIDNIGRPNIEQPDIIEFFGITVNREAMEIESTMGMLIRPRNETGAETERITGITWRMLFGQPMFVKFALELKAHIESHDRIVCHNAGFDTDMINIEFDRLGMTIDWPEKFCTIEATEFLNGYRLNLDALHTHYFGEGFNDHHRAEPDTRATARCYIEMLRQGHA